MRAPHRGDLKIAVLINEVGAVDVDSVLVNLKQVAHDIKATSLHGSGRRVLDTLLSSDVSPPTIDGNFA